MPFEPLRAALIGNDTLLLECGDIWIEKGHTIVAVASDAPRVRDWAARRGLRSLTLQDFASALQAETFDYLLSITHLALLPEAVLRLPRRAAINFHDGPLPRYAGLNAPAWALMNGETQYGISWHEIRGGIDEGDVLVQRVFDIAPGETALSLNTRNFAAAIESFTQLVDELAEDRATRTPQNLGERSYFGKHARPPCAATLQFDRPARDLVSLVRGLDFGEYENPLALPKLWHRGQVLLVRAAEVSNAVAQTAMPGEVVAIGDAGIEIATADGTLRVLAVSDFGGASLPPLAAAAQLGLEVGTRLDGIPAPVTAAWSERMERYARAEAFWVERLRTLEPATLALASPERSGGPIERIALQVPASASSHATLIAGLATYVARTSGKARVDFSLRDAGRDELGLFGALISPELPLRFELDESASIRAATAGVEADLARIAAKPSFVRDVFARYPGLRSRRALASSALAQVAIVASPEATPALPTGAICALALAADGAELWCDSAALGGGARARLKHQLEAWLAATAARPEDPIGSLPLLSDSEAAQLASWNATQRPVAADTIHGAFEAQVARTPDQVALIFEAQSLTYRELDARAERLAAHLRALGVGPDTIVGVYVERSHALVIACLGILKAGGAYLPLDPDYPAERVTFMMADSGVRIVVTQPALEATLPHDIAAVDVDAPASSTAPARQPSAAENLAYVIYTSGSTGKPKGVLVEHRNVANFFAGMDAVIEREPGDTWLSVTSLSFDISVLELFWTLARGFRVIVYRDSTRTPGVAPQAGAAPVSRVVPKRAKPIDFSLYMWGARDTASANMYSLMLEAARFGDTHKFAAIWTPERHFHAFGGQYPNPAVTSAAIATVTERIQIRAGSCVAPLHHPARIAEEWSVVDNLSGGRAAISFASGWQPDDFLLQPANYAENKRVMAETIDRVRRLWRGEELEFPGPLGKDVRIRTQPRPVQAELPFWMTTAGSPESFRIAGRTGAHVLTHLLGQSIEEVGEKIAIYRAAREEAGFDPSAGIVTLMLHTHIGESVDAVRARVREPMKAYLKSSVNLIKGFAWAFPAFKRPAGTNANPNDIDIAGLSAEELDAVLEFAFERYFETSGLFGTPESCLRIIERLEAIGVDDVACLIDFGVAEEQVIRGFEYLDRLRALAQERTAVVSAGEPEAFDLASQIRRHAVTHMQCTPALLRMARTEDDARAAIDSVKHLFVGGEAFPRNLAEELRERGGTVTNMYGPTETTVWSATHRLTSAGPVPLGRPIANTRLYVLDSARRPLPLGVPGELYIAGAGVVRGYHARPELTAERFIEDPFAAAHSGERMYRTGDLVRWSEAGELEFLGRTDHQVKVRGYRIELGEIEALLLRQPGVSEGVVIAREDVPGDVRLVAYLTGTFDEAALREAARRELPSYMVPAVFVRMERLPHTPNGKVDRRALPPPRAAADDAGIPFVAPENELEETVARLWCEVLGRSRVGAEDNFFDLGGHSLLVVKLHRRLRAELPVEVSLTDLYRFPTVRSLVARLRSPDQDHAVEQARDRAAMRLERQASRRDLASRRRAR